MMQRRYVTVDVFTDRLFGGNPLAVVLDAEGLSGAQMQQLAREFNYSETCFVLPPADPHHDAHVRIFTPGQELPFAGHPNVGTAFVLGRERAGIGPSLVFEEQAGLVPVQLLLEGGVVIGAELTAPAPFSRGGTVDQADAAACLSLDPHDLAVDRHLPVIASTGLPFLLVELADRDALRRARADIATIARVLPPHGVDGIYLYTRVLEPADAGTDMQARMFAPLDGIPEDPATGSATCAMIGLQAALLEAPDTVVSLVVGQGFDMGRPSLLHARAVRQGGQVGQVQVGGRCVSVMQGSFELTGEG
ncbi:PhzF family phenazine biosynthesis protein [Lichenicola sp.]|uniref:PhzF family phenazine biosynthesis protein n=1 Tax=Lichenicola sp. TaxID=2804529 RepID=UPI003B006517